WDIQVAHDGVLKPWQPGDRLTPPRHQFWARSTPAAAWALEFLLEDHDGDRWLYRRDHHVSLPLDQLGRVSAEGLPYICPGVALLFKARGHDIDRNAAGFEAAAPALDAGRGRGCGTRCRPRTPAIRGSHGLREASGIR